MRGIVLVSVSCRRAGYIKRTDTAKVFIINGSALSGNTPVTIIKLWQRPATTMTSILNYLDICLALYDMVKAALGNNTRHRKLTLH